MHPESLPQEIDRQHESGSVAPAESSTGALRRLTGRLWYWWSLAAAGALLLVLGVPVLIVVRLANRPEWLYPFALFGARNWLRLSGARVRTRGLEHLDPGETYVFVANHRSFLDTAALFYHLGRRIGILAKKELLKVPVMGYGMGFVNILAIDRTSRERAARTLKAATDRLRKGVSIGVFAEGTRALPGQLLPFKRGAFYLARDAGVRVVPVAIKNTDALMGKGTGTARPGAFEMVVLPPVETAWAATDDDVRRLAEQTNALIAEELGLVDRKS